jgi:hypothetical protein
MILAFDTSGKDLHIGLFDDRANDLGAFHHVATPTERGVHDSMLAEQTSRLIDAHGLSVRDIKRIAYIAGPGSFTGLRIGLAFAKGLAFAGAVELVPVIAHVVLKESAIASHPDSMFAGIATTGYEPTTAYMCDFDHPEDVVLRRIVDLRGPLIVSTDLLATCTARGIEAVGMGLDLNVLARLSRSIAPAEDLASLEPFYGTDFKPHPGATKG